MKTVRALLCVMMVFCLCVVPALGNVSHVVEKWSGETVMPVGPEEPDGLVDDFQNSYAWSMVEMEGFLYVGTVRNYLAQMFSAMPENLLSGLIVDGDDDRAKIYRKPLDSSGDWEMVYESPLATVSWGDVVLETGYRAMTVYQGDLYVVSYPFGAGPYSRILRFDGEDLGAFVDMGTTPLIPEEVLRVPNKTGSGLRSILSSPDGNTLFVGVDSADFDATGGISEIPEGLETEVTILSVEGIPASQDPVSGDATFFATEGWVPVGEPEDFPGVGFFPGWSGVWDMIWYNGELLVSIADPMNGFQLFAGSPCEDDWIWRPVVSKVPSVEKNGEIYLRKYPAGLGNVENAAASPVLFDGKIYMGTFSNWKPLLELFVSDPEDIPGGLLYILTHWTPPQIYRFDDMGNCEMVVGDPGVSSPLFNECAGNARAGFYEWPWPSMTEVDLERLLGDALGLGVSVDEQFNFSFQRYIWRMSVHKGRIYASTMDARSLLQWLGNAMGQSLGVDSLSRVLQVLDIVNDDPAGFNLYYSEDGAEWHDITRDGGFGEIFGMNGKALGDFYNYGGRTLVSAEEGLFLGTANPFKGCQVFRVEPHFQDSTSFGEDWKMIITTCPEADEQAQGELVVVESVDGFDVSSADRVFRLDVDDSACRVQLYLYQQECPGSNSLFILQGGIWTELVGVLDPEAFGPYYLNGESYPCRILYEFDRGTDPSAGELAALTFAFSDAAPAEEDLGGGGGEGDGSTTTGGGSGGCNGFEFTGLPALALAFALMLFRK